MAIIACRECGKEVSNKALKCPSCGVQLNKPKRSFMGKLIKWIFILFNLLMIVLLFQAFNGAAEVVNTAQSEAEQAGAALGTGIGVTVLFIFWVMIDIILGLFVMFTRPKG